MHVVSENRVSMSHMQHGPLDVRLTTEEWPKSYVFASTNKVSRHKSIEVDANMCVWLQTWRL